MHRTDQRLRQAARDGDPVTQLRERMRAGHVSVGAVRLLAYVGNEAARAALPECVVCLGNGAHRDGGDWVSCDLCPHYHDPAGAEACYGECLFLTDWLAGLLRLAAEVPGGCDLVVTCATCAGTGIATQPLGPGAAVTCRCRGTGKRAITHPWAERLPVVAALAAGRVALPVWEDHYLATIGSVGAGRPRQALEAVEAWLAEPTEERREALWRLYRAGGLPDWCGYLLLLVAWPLTHGEECDREAIQAAARVADPEAVRAAICGAVVGELTG